MKKLLLLFAVGLTTVLNAQTFPQISNKWGENDSIVTKKFYRNTSGELVLENLYSEKFTIDSSLYYGYNEYNYDSLNGQWKPKSYAEYFGDSLEIFYQWNTLLGAYEPYGKQVFSYNNNGCLEWSIYYLYDPLLLLWQNYNKMEYYYSTGCSIDSNYFEVQGVPSLYGLVDSIRTFERKSYYSYDQANSTYSLTQQVYQSEGDTLYIYLQTFFSSALDTFTVVYRKYDIAGNEIIITESPIINFVGTPTILGRYISDSTYFINSTASLILKEKFAFNDPLNGGGINSHFFEQWVYSSNKLDNKSEFSSSNQLISRDDFYYFPNGYLEKWVSRKLNGSSLDTNRVIEIEHYTLNNVSTKEPFISSLIIVPNPAYNEILISGVGDNFYYQILSLEGVIIKDGYSSERISIEDIPAGMYSVELQIKDEHFRSKFIKQ